MKIWKHLRTEHIFLNTPLSSKETLLRFVADTCARDGVVKDASALYQGMQDREQTMSTGVGGGIGFPHTTSQEAKEAAVLLIRLAAAIDFEALDAVPVDIVLALIIPENETRLHLQILAGASRLCRNPNFLKAVRKAENSEALWTEIKNLEEKMAFH
ncbi:MAG: PTS sugar transporter subunit IIA [Desulfobacterales bacterium]|nr:PTS sugar transporter subunit IIA [Desulfobacterales bacterium]